MFRVIFSCRKRNVQGLIGVITKYCNTKEFDTFLVSEYEFTKLYGVGVTISLSQHKYKSLCPDQIRDELIHLVRKYYKSSYFILYVIRDTKFFNSF